MPRSVNKPTSLSYVKIAPPINIAIKRVAWLDMTSNDMPALTRFFGRLSPSMRRRKLKSTDHIEPEQNDINASAASLAVGL